MEKYTLYCAMDGVFCPCYFIFCVFFQTMQRIPNFFIDLKVPSVNVVHAVAITREELKKWKFKMAFAMKGVGGLACHEVFLKTI